MVTQKQVNPIRQIVEQGLHGGSITPNQMQALFSFAIDKVGMWDDSPEAIRECFEEVMTKKIRHYQRHYLEAMAQSHYDTYHNM